MLSRRSLLTSIFRAAATTIGLSKPQMGGESIFYDPEVIEPVSDDVFRSDGVTTFINAGEPFTALSGAPIRPEVRAAMLRAEFYTVRLADVQDAVGRRLAKLLGCEAAMITAGAASGLTLGTAACMTGTDTAKIALLPDIRGMPNEVIVQKAHQYDYPYQHAVRNCGVTIVPVETSEELRSAISTRSACMLFNNRWSAKGAIEHEEFVDIGRQYRVLTFIDCAADVPPAENLTKYTKMGFDLVIFSGGKGLRAPSGTGLLIGRRYLVEAAKLK